MSKYPVVFVVADKAQAFSELIPGAALLGDKVEAVYVGNPDDAAQVFGLGASKLLDIVPQQGQIYENYAPTIAQAIGKQPKALVLLPADRRGRAMAAKLGVALKAAVVNDVNAFEEDGKLGHMVYGGLAQGLEKPATPIVIATVAPGTFETREAAAGSGPIEELVFVAPKNSVTLKETRPRQASSANIGKARRLVSIGRGFSKKEDVALASNLAALLGAELACSRPIAEGEKWLERERYIGVSGVMVKPEIYMAVGISGQVQHMVGARDSKVIIAINKDKNAPIFKYADYGIVGDLYKVLPALAKALS